MSKGNEKIFVNMYFGETRRDASSSVRGFLFQDLVAIEELLKETTTGTCSEYIEDVFSISKDEVRVIQVKYYPATDPNTKMTSIIRDLYYQYLRLKKYGYEGKIIPVMYIYSKQELVKPTSAELLKYINIKECEQNSATEQFHQWMEENVYSKNKDEAQQVFFNRFADEISMREFLDALDIAKNPGTLENYRNDLAIRINNLSFPECCIIDNEMRKNILLGLAVQYIQETYNDQEINETDKIFERRKRERTDFIAYLSENISTEKESQIASYVRSVIFQTWERIEKNNSSLSQRKIDILQCICDCTANWIYTLCLTAEGQFQLLNTVSREPRSIFEDFFSMSISQRLQLMHEHKECIVVFLRYLWKVMLNIILKSLSEKEEEIIKSSLFNPETFFDPDEKKYLKSVFPKESVTSAVILSGVGSGGKWENIKNILDRMKIERPQKWYLENDIFCSNRNYLHGCYSYSQTVSEIKNTESVSVASLSQDMFCIECMACVKVDLEEWDELDCCENTIFKNNCIRE